MWNRIFAFIALMVTMWSGYQYAKYGMRWDLVVCILFAAWGAESSIEQTIKDRDR